jgi:glutaredoxin 2
MSNLPSKTTDGRSDTKQFFDKFFNQQVSFPAAEIDATVGFFLKRNFDVDSARSTAIVLLNQARIDNISVFSLLDSLKIQTDVQLSQIVAQVLNSYREKTSLLGYRIAPSLDTYESRNILV